MSLDAALDAVLEVLKDGKSTLFRKPVLDLFDLPDYATVIEKPIDLGSIAKQLEAGRRSNWRRSSYSSAEEVLADGLLVFDNCEKYNKNDAHTRQLADDSRQVFLRAWQAAGLEGPEPKPLPASKRPSSKDVDTPAAKKGGARGAASAEKRAEPPAGEPPATLPPIDPATCKPEEDVPAKFSIAPGKGELPLRLLDYFSLVGGKRGSQLTGLEALDARGGAFLTLRGVLLAPGGRAVKRNGQQFHVEVKDVLEWMATAGGRSGGGSADSPSVWVVTSAARYRLLAPAAAYEDSFARTLRRVAPEGRNAKAAAAADAMLAEGAGDMSAVGMSTPSSSRAKRPAATAAEPAAEPDREKRSSRKRQTAEAASPGSAAPDSSPAEPNGAEHGEPRSKRLKLRLGCSGVGGGGGGGSASGSKEQAQVPRLTVRLGGFTAGASGTLDGQARSARKAPSRELLYSGAKAAEQRRADEAARRREKQQAARQARVAAAAEAVRQRHRKEKAASTLRGPPPPLRHDFRLQPDLLGDLLVVWEFTQTFGDILGLAPFPLWRLEAAVAPGPTRLPAAQSAVEEAVANQEADPTVRTRRQRDAEEADTPRASGIRVKLKVEGSGTLSTPDAAAAAANTGITAPAAASAALMPSSGCGRLPAPEPVGPPVIDAAGAATAVLLRDMHCALLRAYQDKVEEEQPVKLRAALHSPDGSTPGTWAGRCGTALLTAPLGWVEEPAREAGLALAYGDYTDVPPAQRIAALAGLTTLALAGEKVRDLLGRRAEEMATARAPKLPPPAVPQAAAPAADALPATPGAAPDTGATPDPAAAAPPVGPAAGPSPAGARATSATAPPQPAPGFSGLVADWVKWREGARLGLRRALGWDYHRRRYWAFGSAAAAWRLYIEHDSGAAWGYYDGEDIAAVVAWLQRGRIDREAGLLKALSAIPLVRSLPVPPAPAPPPGMLPAPPPPVVQVSVPAGAVLTTEGQPEPLPILPAAQLAASRPDGYTSILAPLTRGEGNWATLGLYASMEGRILSACDALLGCAPFWFRGQKWMQRHAVSLELIAAARGPVEMARAVAAVEGSLAEAGVLSAAWLGQWQPRWRASLAAAPDMHSVLLHVGALQEEVGRGEVATGGVVLSRSPFLHIADQLHCPLFLPWPGDQVVLLRSGLMRHLRTYMCRLGVLRPVPGGQPAPAQPEGPRRGRRPQPDSAAGQARAAAAAAQAAHYVATSPLLAAGSLQAEQAAGSDGRRSQSPAAEAVAAGGKQPAVKTVTTAIIPPIDDAVELEEVEPADEAGAALAAQWKGLLAHVQALRPLERFRVASIGYRRSLAVGEPADTAVPVLWLLLRPSRLGPPLELPAEELGAPLQLDRGLPDYVVPADAFDAGRRHAWAPGNRFRMYFGGKKAGPTKRSGGVYYKGTVLDARVPPTAGLASPDELAAFDPWESVRVEWDVTARDEERIQSVSPWEIERDPEEEALREAQRRKEEEAAARAARAARAKSRRLYGPASDDEGAGGAARQPRARAGSAAPATAPGMPAALPDFGAPGSAAPPPLGAQLLPPPAASPAGEAVWHLPDDRGGEVPPEVLDAIRPLDREHLTMLLTNYLVSIRGKFKPIIFARMELDLHRVFWEVQNRGGYNAVCRAKLWKEVCRSLGLDLRGQTSASYNMRLNYEKSLLDFEHYLSSGAYADDVAAGRAPRHDVVVELPRGGSSVRSVPGSAASLPLQEAAPAAAASLPPLPAEPLGATLSFTALLAGEEEAARPLPPAAAAAAPLLAAAAVGGQSALPPLGQLLQSMARGLLGLRLLRFWNEPDEKGWFKAVVADWNADTGEHKLVYNAHSAEESFEWCRLSELNPAKELALALDPCAPITVPGTVTVSAVAQPPTAQQLPAAETSQQAEQAVLAALVAGVQGGISAATLHSLVDAAVQPLPPQPQQPPISRLRIKSQLLAAAELAGTPAAEASAGLMDLANSAAADQPQALKPPQPEAPAPKASAAEPAQRTPAATGSADATLALPLKHADQTANPAAGAPPLQQTAPAEGGSPAQLSWDGPAEPPDIAVPAETDAAAEVQQQPAAAAAAGQLADVAPANGRGGEDLRDGSPPGEGAVAAPVANGIVADSERADEAVSPHPEAADPVAMEVDQQAEPVPISQPLKLRFKLQGSGQL